MRVKDITISVDEKVLAAVRRYAAKRSTTVNQLVRDYLGEMRFDCSGTDEQLGFGFAVLLIEHRRGVRDLRIVPGRQSLAPRRTSFHRRRSVGRRASTPR